MLRSWSAAARARVRRRVEGCLGSGLEKPLSLVVAGLLEVVLVTSGVAAFSAMLTTAWVCEREGGRRRMWSLEDERKAGVAGGFLGKSDKRRQRAWLVSLPRGSICGEKRCPNASFALSLVIVCSSATPSLPIG